MILVPDMIYLPQSDSLSAPRTQSIYSLRMRIIRGSDFLRREVKFYLTQFIEAQTATHSSCVASCFTLPVMCSVPARPVMLKGRYLSPRSGAGWLLPRAFWVNHMT